MENKMGTIRIAICDDEEFYRKELEKLIQVYGNEAEADLLIEIYAEAQTLTEEIMKKNKMYDIIFFDVDMPEMSGIEAAKEIRKVDQQVLLCFVTSYEKYALDAYGVDAVGYVIKPMKYTDVKRIVEKAKILIYYRMDQEKANQRYLEVVSARDKVLLDLEKVVYIEKRRNQCVFHMTDGEQVCYDTLANVYKQLDPETFQYTHQGYIANFHYIKEVRRDAVCFGSGMEIPISRKYYEPVRKRHMDKIYRIRDERNHGMS